MVNKRSRNTPKVTKSKSSSKAIFDKAKTNDKLCIKTYDMSTIPCLSQLDSFLNICKLCVSCFVGIAMLCQLRALRPDGNSANMDRLPSFKYYKKNLLLEDAGQALAIALAACLPEVIIHFPDNPMECEIMLISILDSFQGNEKFIEKVSESNLAEYIWGHCARILGIINSCPAANMGAFNIGSDVVNWSVQDVLNRLPKELVGDLTPADVIGYIRSQLLKTDADGNVIPLEFAETPFAGGFSVNGCCKLEQEIFGDNLPIRTMISTIGIAKPSVKAVPDDAKDYLSPLELRKFTSAIFVQKRNLISYYESLIEKRKADPSLNPNVSDISSTDVNADQADSASS